MCIDYKACTVSPYDAMETVKKKDVCFTTDFWIDVRIPHPLEFTMRMNPPPALSFYSVVASLSKREVIDLRVPHRLKFTMWLNLPSLPSLPSPLYSVVAPRRTCDVTAPRLEISLKDNSAPLFTLFRVFSPA